MLLDFSQAFDKVIHHHISDMLSISNNTHDWINSFLSQCKQSVLAKCTHSSWATTTSGVPLDSSRILPGLLLHRVSSGILPGLVLYRVSSRILPGFFLGYYYIGCPPGFCQDFSWVTTTSGVLQDSSRICPGLLLNRVPARIRPGIFLGYYYIGCHPGLFSSSTISNIIYSQPLRSLRMIAFSTGL